MATQIGAAKTARDLGIPVNTLYAWINRTKAHGEHAHVGSGKRRLDASHDEPTKLAKRIKELEKANQILKDALGFFVVSQKK